MNDAPNTQVWYVENVRRINQEVNDFKQRTGLWPFLVIMDANSSEIFSLRKWTVLSSPASIRRDPLFKAVVEAHERGAYNDINGDQIDVPIICRAGTVYQSSLNTAKLEYAFSRAFAAAAQQVYSTDFGVRKRSRPKSRSRKRKRRR